MRTRFREMRGLKEFAKERSLLTALVADVAGVCVR